ncbi:hypothetical protein [Parasphingorhabdus sp.]|uniref:hypothetical protein n=1 Tax=Parasphingorhabdus sp. TaxID=2709688 RepID=UPI003002255E
MFKNLRYLWALLALALVPVAAEAAGVSPMVVEVKPLGRGSIARIELSNPSQAEFPVEVQMFRGIISERGELELTPADEEFLLFPAQRIVPAQSQQVFRLQYIGEPELSESEIYYMQIRQIPVDIKPGESQVQVVVNFNILVNVVPDGTNPEPMFESITPVVRDDVAGVEVRLANHGSRYFMAGLSPWQITGTADDGSPADVRLPADAVAKLIGVGVVAPGRARVFFIPTDKPLVEGSIQAKLGS